MPFGYVVLPKGPDFCKYVFVFDMIIYASFDVLVVFISTTIAVKSFWLLTKWAGNCGSNKTCHDMSMFSCCFPLPQPWKGNMTLQETCLDLPLGHGKSPLKPTQPHGFQGKWVNGFTSRDIALRFRQVELQSFYIGVSRS